MSQDPPSQPPTTPYAMSPYGQNPPPGSPVPANERYNVLAIVSLLSAFVLSLAAIITGHIALSQIKRTGEKGRGLAIAGLVLGYLGILAGIIGIILWVVFVVFAINASSAIDEGSFFSDDPVPTSESQPFTTPVPSAGGGTDASGQTQTEACLILESSVADSASALSDLTDVGTDPQSAIDALGALSGDFDTALAQISNPDVLQVASTTSGDLNALIADIQSYQSDPASADTTQMLTAAGALQSDFGDIATLCE